jgi:hypothetical protein
MNEEACCAISAPAAAAHDHCSWCTGRLRLTLETAYLFLSKTTVDGQNVLWVLGAVLQHFVVLVLVAKEDGKKDGCLDMNAVQEGKTRKARKETNIAVDVVDFILTYNVRVVYKESASIVFVERIYDRANLM